MNKFYGAHDQWTDLDKQNDVLITSTDGVIDSVKVNGEDYGGGGSSDLNNPIELELIDDNGILTTKLTAIEIYELCQTGTPYFTLTAEQVQTYIDPYKPNTKYFINECLYDDSEDPAVVGLRFVMLGIADTSVNTVTTELSSINDPSGATEHIFIAGGA